MDYNGEQVDFRVVVEPAAGELEFGRVYLPGGEGAQCEIPAEAEAFCAGMTVPAIVTVEATPSGYGFTEGLVRIFGNRLNPQALQGDAIEPDDLPRGIPTMSQGQEGPLFTDTTFYFSPDGALWASISEGEPATYHRMGMRTSTE